MILPNLQPSNHDHNDVTLIEMGDIYNTLLENAQPSTTADVLPPVLDWRCAVPVIDTVPQSPPTRFDSRIFNYHEVLIARDVRKHEKSLPWTNKNYSLLSQVVNSLSLSQSDTDRLLNAVIYLYIASATIVDHRYTAGFQNVDAGLLPSVEGGRGKSFGRHKDEGTRLVNAGPALLHTRCVYDLS